eukprot:668540_1
MGSTSSSMQGTDRGTPLFAINKPITSTICNVIQDEMKCEDLHAFPCDLMKQCTQFIGFFLYSSILSQTESLSLHLLLSKHNKKRKLIGMNRANKHHVKYYDLLYRSSVNGENGKYTNRSFKRALDKAHRLNKPNLVIIYETEYDHVFAVYLHRKLKQNKEGHFIQNTDRDIAGCLLRSKSEGGHDCPRLIEFKNAKQHFMGSHQLLSSNDSKIHLFEIDFFPAKIGIKRKYDREEHCRIHRSCFLDISTVELVGFELRDTFDKFNLKQVEMFQIL